MQFLLDHLASVVIAGIILLATLVTQYRGGQANIDAKQFHNAKTRMLDLVETIERDFNNIGSGVDSTRNAITKFDTTSTIAEFSFLARTDPTNPLAQTVTYQWEEEGTARLQDKTSIPTYTVRRLIDGAVSGSSMDAITRVQIDLLTADSLMVVGNLSDTRLINVFLQSVSTVGTNARLERTSWHKAFRPVNMTREPE